MTLQVKARSPRSSAQAAFATTALAANPKGPCCLFRGRRLVSRSGQVELRPVVHRNQERLPKVQLGMRFLRPLQVHERLELRLHRYEVELGPFALPLIVRVGIGSALGIRVCKAHVLGIELLVVPLVQFLQPVTWGWVAKLWHEASAYCCSNDAPAFACSASLGSFSHFCKCCSWMMRVPSASGSHTLYLGRRPIPRPAPGDAGEPKQGFQALLPGV